MSKEGRSQRTYGLQEKSVVVEIILNEQKVSLASFSRTLNHYVQGALEKKKVK